MKLYKDGDCVCLTNEDFIAGYKANGWTECPPAASVEEIIDLGNLEEAYNDVRPIDEAPVVEEITEEKEPKKEPAAKKTATRKSGSKKAKK